MTKMAAMAINSKHLLKIFFSRTRRPMILKLGMKYQAIELYKVCINHDPGMALTFFLQRGQLRPPMHLNGKNRKMSFNGKKNLLGMSKWTKDLCL